MDKLSLQNPLFATYVIAATLMILKVVAMSWLTVVRMMQVNGGFRSPEDLRRTPLNPSPDPKQIERNEAVDRIRRIQLNDLENVPFFLVAAFLYILTEPSLTARACCSTAMSSRGSPISPPISPRRRMTCGRRSGPSAR